MMCDLSNIQRGVVLCFKQKVDKIYTKIFQRKN